jgi:hypothetical protein
MKTLKQNIVLIAAITMLLTSCQKNIETDKVASVQADDAQTDSYLRCHNCLVTHSEENIFGSTIDFFYNKNSNPDSLNFDGTPVKLKYDKLGRLLKLSFGDYAWDNFTYSGINPFPVTRMYYYPAFGGLLEIDSFRYNLRGEMIKRIVTDVNNPEYNSIETYSYNNFGNVVKVDIAAYNGGTVYNPGYTEFSASKYDSKPNFMTGSVWSKFMFFNTEYDGGPYLWMLFSKNNAANYIWTYDDAGDSYSVTSSFQYNNAGFANNINMDYYDNVAAQDLGIFTRTSSSTCDASAVALQHPLSKSLLHLNNPKQLERGLPLLIHKKAN